jgi:hypothetical protein
MSVQRLVCCHCLLLHVFYCRGELLNFERNRRSFGRDSLVGKKDPNPEIYICERNLSLPLHPPTS